MRVKRLLVAAAVPILGAVIAFPYVANFLSRPEGLVSLTEAERQMRSIGQAVRAYRAGHNGRIPQSSWEFVRYLQDRPGHEEIKKKFSDGTFQYHSSTPSSQEPVLVTCYLPYRHGKTLLWVDQEGKVFRSRVWLWPTWSNR